MHIIFDIEIVFVCLFQKVSVSLYLLVIVTFNDRNAQISTNWKKIKLANTQKMYIKNSLYTIFTL